MSSVNFRVEYCTKAGEPHGTRTLSVPNSDSKSELHTRFKNRIGALIGIDSNYIVILQYWRSEEEDGTDSLLESDHSDQALRDLYLSLSDEQRKDLLAGQIPRISQSLHAFSLTADDVKTLREIAVTLNGERN